VRKKLKEKPKKTEKGNEIEREKKGRNHANNQSS
jgi:hypothetical protein